LGCHVWDQNANDNVDWLHNPNRLGVDDLGFIYGAVGRNFPIYKPQNSGPKTIDLVAKVYNDLLNRIDNRSEIITFYHPGSFHLGCLTPCLFQYQYSILNDTLYLNAYQRSCDVPIGLCFNMIQVYFMLAIMAKITGLKPGKAYHKLVNAHIYEDQIPLVEEQIKRVPYLQTSKFIIDENINTLNDLDTWVIPDNFKVENYEHHDPIKYPFSV
jgi:thymidylate synthase